MTIKTASWFTKLPDDHQQIGISRGVPRGMKAGYRRYPALNPGAWFNKVSAGEYLARYNAEILAPLDPKKVADDLMKLGAGKVPVLLCFEDPRGCSAGSCWCHRHIVAQWLENYLGITVPEVDHPLLDRWTKLRHEGVTPPSYW
jgi:hypothetical protein